MGLFEFFKKSKKASESELSKENMEKLDSDGGLPFGWISAHKAFVSEAEAEYKAFWKLYADNEFGSPKKKCAALKSLLQYISDARRKYEKMGECYLFYFENWWASKEEVKSLTDELKRLEDNLDELEAEYARNQYIEHVLIPELKQKALNVVKENPGIIQTDAYSYFDPDMKAYVQDAFRILSKEGKIKREKHGRTYKLTT